MKLVERSELRARRHQPWGLLDHPRRDHRDPAGLEGHDRVAQDDREDQLALKRFRVHLRRALA